MALEVDERAREDREAALLALERRLSGEAAEVARREARLRTKQVMLVLCSSTSFFQHDMLFFVGSQIADGGLRITAGRRVGH